MSGDLETERQRETGDLSPPMEEVTVDTTNRWRRRYDETHPIATFFTEQLNNILATLHKVIVSIWYVYINNKNYTAIIDNKGFKSLEEVWDSITLSKTVSKDLHNYGEGSILLHINKTFNQDHNGEGYLITKIGDDIYSIKLSFENDVFMRPTLKSIKPTTIAKCDILQNLHLQEMFEATFGESIDRYESNWTIRLHSPEDISYCIVRLCQHERAVNKTFKDNVKNIKKKLSDMYYPFLKDNIHTIKVNNECLTYNGILDHAHTHTSSITFYKTPKGKNYKSIVHMIDTLDNLEELESYTYNKAKKTFSPLSENSKIYETLSDNAHFRLKVSIVDTPLKKRKKNIDYKQAYIIYNKTVVSMSPVFNITWPGLNVHVEIKHLNNGSTLDDILSLSAKKINSTPTDTIIHVIKSMLGKFIKFNDTQNLKKNKKYIGPRDDAIDKAMKIVQQIRENILKLKADLDRQNFDDSTKRKALDTQKSCSKYTGEKLDLDIVEYHHHNGINWDNRPENCLVTSPDEHAILSKLTKQCKLNFEKNTRGYQLKKAERVVSASILTDEDRKKLIKSLFKTMDNKTNVLEDLYMLCSEEEQDEYDDFKSL